MSAAAVPAVEYVSLFKPSSPFHYWCRLCPKFRGSRDKHGIEHYEKDEADLQNGEWVTLPELVAVYELQKRRKAGWNR